MGSKEAYEKIICGGRLRTSARSLDAQFLSDKGRIISSAPFRRLQAKAQVFLLEGAGGARTRLTHSLEVANLGQNLAHTIFERLQSKGLISKELFLPFITAVECSCLMHDIGNPPFGHFCESSIRKWFSSRKDKFEQSWGKESAARYLPGLAQYYDGNAQGLRNVSVLAWHGDEFGLNLTATTVTAYMKYLHSRIEGGLQWNKKVGYFAVDEDRVKAFRQIVGIDHLAPIRSPLTFIVEAADDIAFCMSDIEDGVEKGIIRPGDVEEHLLDLLKDDKEASRLICDLQPKKDKFPTQKGYAAHKGRERFVELKIQIINLFLRRLCEAYIQHHDDIISGKLDRRLMATDEPCQNIAQALREVCYAVFHSREVIDMEILARRVVMGILDGFEEVFFLKTHEFADLRRAHAHQAQDDFEKRLVLRLPERYLQAFDFQVGEKKHPEPVLRAHLIVDFLAGMTDHYALQLYQTINGVSRV